MIRHVAMGLISNEAGQILMALRRPSQSRPSMFEISGGAVEPGESNEEAVVRELREELGVETRIVDHIADEVLDLEVDLKFHLYAVRIISGTPRPLEAVRLAWTMIDFAIVSMPCVPSTYLFYRRIKRYLGQ